MAATYNDIASWLCSIQKQNSEKRLGERKVAYVLMVCDTFDYSDYCVVVYEDEDINEKLRYYNDHQKMSSVMEVYDLKKDIQEQLSLHRAWSVPEKLSVDKQVVSVTREKAKEKAKEAKEKEKRAKTSKKKIESKTLTNVSNTQPKILRRSTRKRTLTDRYKPY